MRRGGLSSTPLGPVARAPDRALDILERRRLDQGPFAMARRRLLRGPSFAHNVLYRLQDGPGLIELDVVIAVFGDD